MDEQIIQKIKKTLVVILKERNRPNEVMLVGLGIRWEPRSVENNNYHDENSLWELNIFFPADAYARMDRTSFSEPEEIIKSVLNEITGPQRDIFVSVHFCPELVDQLSFSQEQLMEWLDKSLSKQNQTLTAA